VSPRDKRSREKGAKRGLGISKFDNAQQNLVESDQNQAKEVSTMLSLGKGEANAFAGKRCSWPGGSKTMLHLCAVLRKGGKPVTSSSEGEVIQKSEM